MRHTTQEPFLSSIPSHEHEHGTLLLARVLVPTRQLRLTPTGPWTRITNTTKKIKIKKSRLRRVLTPAAAAWGPKQRSETTRIGHSTAPGKPYQRESVFRLKELFVADLSLPRLVFADYYYRRPLFATSRFLTAQDPDALALLVCAPRRTTITHQRSGRREKPPHPHNGMNTRQMIVTFSRA